MKAVRYHGLRDIRVEDVPAPGQPGPGQVLVAPRLCGICGTDLHEYIAGPIVTFPDGHRLTGAGLPQIFGHEFSAEVLAVGAGVRSVVPGQRVVAMPHVYCFDCFYCRRGLNFLCERFASVGLSWPWGGMAEQAILDEYQVYPLPDSLSDEQGALVEPAAVALYAVDRAELRAGESVLITGGGPIGGLAALCAIAAGANAVYLSEPNPHRAAQAAALGLTRVFDPREDDVATELRELHEGVGVDVAIECSGQEAGLRTCCDAVRRQGRVIQTGLFVRPATVEPEQWTFKDLTIEATWCNPAWYMARVAGMVAAGTLPVERIVTSTIAPDDVVARGFEALVDPERGELKVLVRAGSEFGMTEGPVDHE